VACTAPPGCWGAQRPQGVEQDGPRLVGADLARVAARRNVGGHAGAGRIHEDQFRLVPHVHADLEIHELFYRR